MLSTDDQCAVLCILSHGTKGAIFGRDGRTVSEETIEKELDNVHCIQMADKPKVLIIQACQGG